MSKTAALSLLLPLACLAAACSSESGGEAERTEGGGGSTATAEVHQVEPPTGNGAIAGFVYEDANADQAPSPNEPRVSGAVVWLMNPAGDERMREVTTGADGAFKFDGIAPGDYRLHLTIPQGYVRSSDNSFRTTIRPDGTSGEQHFGVKRAS